MKEFQAQLANTGKDMEEVVQLIIELYDRYDQVRFPFQFKSREPQAELEQVGGYRTPPRRVPLPRPTFMERARKEIVITANRITVFILNIMTLWMFQR